MTAHSCRGCPAADTSLAYAEQANRETTSARLRIARWAHCTDLSSAALDDVDRLLQQAHAHAEMARTRWAEERAAIEEVQAL